MAAASFARGREAAHRRLARVRWLDLDALYRAFPAGRCWYTSKKAQKTHVQAEFRPGDLLVFGKETVGIPEDLLTRHPAQAIRIPIFSPVVRSLNLSTAAGIVLYEALRQCGRLQHAPLPAP